MYWPLGAPRVYAADKRRWKASKASNSDAQTSRDDDEQPNTILGFRVARNGQLFATITVSALTIWQTSVREKPCHLDKF